ncbi:42532_t:CDS:2 [Gigaspora margarita]|uniref:42532_t:CDS:1 n=1 Tax=Gigaspora margarita TaxID=4874 RepID=A0ABM8W1J7_GIGMA|nr:42532_t:CDS:2 [Gigaspora margarita]
MIIFPVFQKKVITIQLTDADIVILTKQNDVKVNEEYNEINEEFLDVYMNTVEFPNIEMSEIQFPEAQFPEAIIKFITDNLGSILEKIREVFEAIIKFITDNIGPILEKIREVFEAIIKFITDNYIIIIAIGIIVMAFLAPHLVIGFIYFLGCGSIGIIKGSFVAIGQSIGALGTCGAGILQLIGFGAGGIIKGSLVAICQSIGAIGLNSSTIQITDEDTDILTKHNDIDVNEEYNKINEESLNVFLNMVELPNIEMSEIKSSEIKSSEIDFDPILEKIREAFASISGIGTCGAGICRLFGCGANGIDDGGCVGICQSFSDICIGGLKLLPVIIVVVGLTMLYLYITGKKEPDNLII